MVKGKALIRILLALASVWSLIAGVYIFFTFGGTQVTEIAINGEASQQTVQQLSWFESQGWWGVAILLIFAVLFYGPLHFYIREQIGWTVIFGIVAVTLSIVAGFSIGTVYWPGSLAVLVALILIPFSKN